MNAITSALTWVAITLIVLACLPVMAVVRLFDRDPARYTTGRLFRWMGGLTTRVNPAWTITRTGSIPPDMRRPYVVVSNHQSNADIPVISRLPWEMKWVAKAALFKVPVGGWMMRMAADIPVDRRSATSRAAVVLHARDRLQKRCSVMFMPEGTRSKSRTVGRFQDGAFRLAIEEGVPVLPLALDGTADALPKHGWRFGAADIRLHVFDPIPTEGMSPDDAPALRERVRRQIIAQVAAWRGVPPEVVDGAPEAGRQAGEEAAKSTPAAEPEGPPG